ncbi:MAG: response regulator [Candidatus Carbobacillus altaicus]|uniref:Sensory box histidine kinase/response regulator n=1 Tax=Candidatus Carbonibacillus altaicus TaxID=2163959 RepID=A0A2R6Y5H4_9BACL|nr:response regulator [Candidatus Carbobacillus altaicus]PTQ57926.1 MAG: sensory box histidine kinase/response regulator [Candidatus Carbobacillus altaicus]
MKRILIVEDNPTNALLFHDVLSEQGYAVDVAEEGERAFELLEQNDYDLLLLDIHLPGMDGLSIARTLRSLPDYQHLKIVGISALVTEREIQAAYAAGFDDYVTKPISLRPFVETIRRHLHEA